MVTLHVVCGILQMFKQKEHVDFSKYNVNNVFSFPEKYLYWTITDRNDILMQKQKHA